MIGLIKDLFATPRLNDGIMLQQQASGPEANILGYKVKSYRDAGKLGGIGGSGIGMYLASTKYGLIPGLFTGAVGGFILGALGGIGLYALYRAYKWFERQIPRGQPQPNAALAYA